MGHPTSLHGSRIETWGAGRSASLGWGTREFRQLHSKRRQTPLLVADETQGKAWLDNQMGMAPGWAGVRLPVESSDDIARASR